MFPGIDPKKLHSLMKQMGIAQEFIKANRVIIETDNKNIIIEEPEIIKIKMQGQVNFQISGNIKEENKNSDESEKLNEEDIKTIMEKTGCDKEKAIEALKKHNGDLAEAILSLTYS